MENRIMELTQNFLTDWPPVCPEDVNLYLDASLMAGARL
jgi:hypothetical protein